MKKLPVILLVAFFAMPAIYGQIKIGDNPQAISPTSVLELESNDRVLVITRINTLQMDAIVPNQGAMIYNTDTQCIHYYDGTAWINLCAAAFEIPDNSIETQHIVNGGINGIDIQDGSIGPGKLQNQSVTQDKLSENSVGAFALDNDNINLSDFTNDQGFITGADIVSTVAGNAISNDGGAYFNDETLQNGIAANTTAIDGHIAADDDTNASNEIQSLTLTGNQLEISGSNTVTLPSTTGEIDDNELITASSVSGTTLTLTEGGIDVDIDLSGLGGGGNPTDELQDLSFNATTNILTLTTPATAGNQVDLSSLAGGGGNQNLAQVLAQGTDGGAALIKNILDPVDPQDAATRAYVLATVASGGGLADGSILIGGAGDVAQQLAVMGDATLANDGTLTVAANAIDSGKIDNDAILLEDLNDNGAGDGQIIKWNNTTGLWEIADDDTGTATLTDGNIFVGGTGDVPTDVTMSGDATIDNLGELTITDDAVELGMLAPPDPAGTPAPADGQIMVWDNTLGEWVIDAQAGEHIATTANAIFFANNDPANLGKPTTTDDNLNVNDNGGLIWDSEARPVGAQTYGALIVGQQTDSPALGTHSKVVITERIVNSHPTQAGLAFPLQLQNESGNIGSSSGIMFAVEPAGDFGKGAVVYERTGAWGVGDFHFLQNPMGDNTIPTITDKAFTIQNDGDIQLYGNIIDKNGVGATQPPPPAETGLVLTNTATGAQWAPATGGSAYTAGTGLTLTGTTFAVDGSTIVADWANLTNIPADIADGDDDTIYTSGAGLTLLGNTFVVDDLLGDVSGPTTATVIGNLRVTTPKIADDAVTVDKVAASTTDGQVLTTSGTDVVWADATGHNGTAAGSIFFSGDATPFAPTEDNAQLFWDNTNDKLYVGPQVLTTGDVKLNVNGTTRTQGIKNSAGSPGLPSYRFTDDLDTGMYLIDNTGILGLSTNNAEAIRIDASQNVGIGTTVPTSKLHTGGSFATATQSAAGGIALDENDHTVVFTADGSIALPLATSCPGRMYIIKNASSVVTCDAYNASDGTNTTTIPAGTVVWLQSVGGNWEQVN